MESNKPIILFDGICNLCDSSVNFILKRDKKSLFRFVTLQSEEGEKIIATHKIPPESDSVILVQNNTVFIESDAAIEICRKLPTPWKWLSITKKLPKKWPDKLYRLIAKNRYKWFGKRDSCRVV